MDKVTGYRELLKGLLHEYERLYKLKPRPGVESFVVFDDVHDSYMLVRLGWEANRRISQVILHVRLRDGKFWIEEEWTEEGIANELLQAGVPREDIVLAFHPPEVRPNTEFAVV